MFFQSTAIVILLLFYGCYYMKLKIAFLQLLPGAAIEDNIEKGIKACREAREPIIILNTQKRVFFAYAKIDSLNRPLFLFQKENKGNASCDNPT